MSWYPGAFAHDFGGTGTCEPDSFVLHEVVNEIDIPVDGSPSGVAEWVRESLATQFYVDYKGSVEQFCSSNRASAHCKDGNGHRLGIETEDDKPQTTAQANAGTWTAQQCERIADLIAWGNILHDIPIRQMTSSRRTEIGVGYHRLGVPGIGGGHDGWPDGEVWTRTRGKPCPGDRRIAQLPGIVDRARSIADGIKAGSFGFLGTGPVHLDRAGSRGQFDILRWIDDSVA